MSDATARPPRADATRRWPDDPAAFGDTTRCPSCFSPLTAVVCGVCGLDLRAPAAAEVLASGRRLLAEETHRRELIDGMFRTQWALASRGADASAAGASREADASAAAAKAPAAVATGLSHASPRVDAAEHAPPTGAPAPLAPPAGAPVPLAPPTGTPVALAAPTGPEPPSARSGPALPTTPSAGPPPWAPAHAAEAASGGPRRSGVQVFLLTLGVVLISVTAIVFLFVAYLVASLEVRSVIIAFASALVLGAAVLLRRRRLPGTAEGVSAVAVVLLLLDVWTVRANELFGTAELRPAAYTGIALMVVAGVAAGVRALSGIRTLGITAAVLAPVALFLLGVGIPEDDPTTAIWLGGLFGLAGAIAASVLRLPTVERLVALSMGVAAGGIAWWSAPFALSGLAWHPLWTFAIVAVTWGALLAALATRGRVLGAAWRWVAAIATGGALAAAPAVAVALELDVAVAAWLAPASAAVVAIVISLVVRAPGAADAGRAARAVDSARSARVLTGRGLLAGAGAVAALAAIPAGLAGALHVGTLLFDAVGGWNAGTVELTEFAPATVIVPLVLAVAATLIALVLRRVRALAWVPLALTGCAFVMLAVSFGDGVVAVVLLLALAALCLAAAAVTVRTPLRGAVPVLAALGPASVALAWAAGFGAVDAWVWSTIGALALTVAGWRFVPRRWPAAASATAPVHAGLAAVQVGVASIAIAPWLTEAGVRLATDWRSPAVWAALVCAVAFSVTLALRASRATVLAVAAPLLAVASAAVLILLVTGGPSVRWLPALALAAGAAAWAWRGRDIGLAAASAAIAPVALTFAAAWILGDVLRFAAQADAVAAGALLAAAALAHLLTRRGAAVRLAWVASTGVLTVIVATVALLGGDWLPLALLAPVPVVLAALWGDPITSSAPMRHLAWASGALAVAAWWTWLVDDGATVVELFTLPVAALCLAIGAVVVARRPRPDRSRAAEPAGFSTPAPVGEPTPGATPTLVPVGEPSIGRDSPRPSATTGRVTLLAVGLAVAVLPSVLAAGDSAVRTIVLVAAGAVTLLATAFAPDRVRDVPVGLLGALTGATAAIGGSVVHATAIAFDDGDTTLNWWALAALVTGLAASIWWARAEREPARFAEWLLAVSALAASFPMIAAIAAGHDVELRALALLPVLAVLHVAAAANAARPFAGPVVRWGSAVGLVVGAFVALMAGVHPFDLAAVPLALALVGAGILDLRNRPSASSWQTLGPGLAVLLLPPLLADFTDPQLWRVVVLGIVALATLFAGIRWRLQAPFVLGGAVLLVHAIAQLWPWITLLYEAVWWWLWLGLAGVLLVVIAATYERQLRLARTTIGRIAALR